MNARSRLALLVASAGLLSGAATAVAPTAYAADDTCYTRSTIGLTCDYDYGRKWAEYGSKGLHVKEIQALINGTTNYRNTSGGSRLTVDGDFGPATERAVRWFQRTYLGASAVDGIVGPNTWHALRGWRY
ncbi:MAG: peptidoglycan-binding protein [Streptomyces sp.]|uniref:peptidoglycan-binding domain-containing protein n=1 Tax=Streptomyces sp. B93 TaxID=2824875 RepID=UPI0019C0D077|nr:peptidoglycan-binding protein [Streptomyces sp. B93]MBC7271148.1 peptidoglycan-binding protein [Streptomyces sp.]MBQ1092247.1 peptidoglycan-binding protein [Streptomyces sp. B93]